jgi:hypothetical protein
LFENENRDGYRYALQLPDGEIGGYGTPVVVVTHQRSGTHLTIDLLRKQFAELQSWVWPYESVYRLLVDIDSLLPRYRRNRISPEQALRWLSRPERPVIKTHALPGFEELRAIQPSFMEYLKENAQFIYAVRDPRSVMCSVHVWKGARVPIGEFLINRDEGETPVERWCRHVEQWTEHSGVRNIEIIRFEDVVKKTKETVEKLAGYLSLRPLWREPLLPAKHEADTRLKNYWARLTRQWESTAVLGRPGGMEPRPWREALSESDLQFMNETAGHLMNKFGYE